MMKACAVFCYLIVAVIAQNDNEKSPANVNGSLMKFYQENPWTGVSSYYSK